MLIAQQVGALCNLASCECEDTSPTSLLLVFGHSGSLHAALLLLDVVGGHDEATLMGRLSVATWLRCCVLILGGVAGGFPEHAIVLVVSNSNLLLFNRSVIIVIGLGHHGLVGEGERWRKRLR